MVTSLKYELKINGKKAKIGDVLWCENINKSYNKVRIAGIKFIDRCGTVYFEPIDNEHSSTIYGVDINDEEEFINKYYFWEKPIKYQLPDTEGNLSEVKVGQEVFSESNTKMKIKELNNGLIFVQWNDAPDLIYGYENITGEHEIFFSIKTNKPKQKRDFSPYFNFDEAPNGFNFGAVNGNGYAYWFKNKPEAHCEAWVNNGSWDGAGFRQNLINPATGIVDDWKDSLVERPKETK